MERGEQILALLVVRLLWISKLEKYSLLGGEEGGKGGEEDRPDIRAQEAVLLGSPGWSTVNSSRLSIAVAVPTGV